VARIQRGPKLSTAYATSISQANICDNTVCAGRGPLGSRILERDRSMEPQDPLCSAATMTRVQVSGHPLLDCLVRTYVLHCPCWQDVRRSRIERLMSYPGRIVYLAISGYQGCPSLQPTAAHAYAVGREGLLCHA
jgi:hypothetical protein